MDISVVILAGGKSTRMGSDKLALTLGGQTLLDSAIGRFKTEFDNICISVADREKYKDRTERIIIDILPGAGPLSGLHAALSHTECEGVFLVAADLPFANARAAKRIIELCGSNEACVIRLPDGKLEPLFGCYRKSLLGRCEDAILSGDFRMTGVLGNAKTRYVSPQELGELWEDKLIFNINYPDDYARISAISATP